jgi:hypothetical protein
LSVQWAAVCIIFSRSVRASAGNLSGVSSQRNLRIVHDLIVIKLDASFFCFTSTFAKKS